MTLRQPTERHGGNARIDEEEVVTENSLDARVALIQSNRTWSELREVAKAVSVASELERQIYVERRVQLYRWSLAHSGGAYPLLRIAARVSASTTTAYTSDSAPCQMGRASSATIPRR